MRVTPLRAAFELYSWLVVLTLSASYHFGGAAGLALHTLVGGFGLVMIDWWISPTMEGNLNKLAKSGYPRPAMWALMVCNLVATNTLVALFTDFFSCFEAAPRLDGALALGFAVNLAVAELTFTGGHYLLHRTKLGAAFHQLHHCCQPCSLSTNLLFHPVDMAVEFSGPFIALVLSHLLLFRDPFLLQLSLHILHLWYTLDHSESLKLYHYQHHQTIDSVYSIYAKIRFTGEGNADTVKPLMAQTTSGSRGCKQL